MKNAKRKAVALLMAAMILAAVLPAYTEAATSVPCKVTRALSKAVDENGRAIIIDQSAGKMYLYKRNCSTQKWELKKSFRCICAVRLDPKKHYCLLRNEDTDLISYTKGTKTYSYAVNVDCYEEPTTKSIRIHSYAEIGGNTYKDSTHNTCGIAVCIDNAHYIWKYYGDGTAVMGV